ncbi:MAG: hypothetical protein J6U20_06915 [Fibrobacter sp.]|nr:hypothetical protein [Fibrobacter sp.]
MRFEHFGLTKMLVVLATFALALGLAGCSGDSSTAADGSSDDQENSAIDSSDTDGSSSSSKGDGSSDEDGSSSSSKKDSSSGKDGSSSSSKKNGSSYKGHFDNVNVPDVKIGECNIKEDDGVWAYAFTETEDDDSLTAFSFTFFDGENIKDSLYRVISGPEATKACKQMNGKQREVDELFGMTITSTRWCKDEVMYIIEVMTIGGMNDVSRKELFETAKEECAKYNEENANSSSSSDGQSSSSSEEEEESSSSAGESASGSTCDFEKDDDVWVMDLVGVGRTTLTWSGNSYTAVSEMSIKLENEEVCEQSVENANPDDHAYCEGSVYKSRAERVVDDADRDEVYESAMAACAL